MRRRTVRWRETCIVVNNDRRGDCSHTIHRPSYNSQPGAAGVRDVRYRGSRCAFRAF